MMKVFKSFLAAFLAATEILSPASAHPKSSNSIVGGVLSGAGQFPYFVNFGCCGGALIAPDVVLTAAHCDVDACDVRNSEFYVGAFERGTTSEGAQVRNCQDWVNDPNYDSTTNEYDFALCKLDSAVTIDETLVVLQLNEDESFPADATDLIAMGMGGTLANDGTDPNFENESSQFLKNVTLPSISNTDCNDVYGIIGDMMVCAMVAEGGEDTCQGDSGGPLVKRNYQGDGTFVDTHIGVVSFGSGCAQPDTPGVYARTSNRMDWIKSVTCDTFGSDASFCTTTGTSPPSLSSSPSGMPSLAPSPGPSSSSFPSGIPSLVPSGAEPEPGDASEAPSAPADASEAPSAPADASESPTAPADSTGDPTTVSPSTVVPTAFVTEDTSAGSTDVGSDVESQNEEALPTMMPSVLMSEATSMAPSVIPSAAPTMAPTMAPTVPPTKGGKKGKGPKKNKSSKASKSSKESKSNDTPQVVVTVAPVAPEPDREVSSPTDAPTPLYSKKSKDDKSSKSALAVR